MGEPWKVRVLAGPRLERGESEVFLPVTAVRVLARLALDADSPVAAQELIDAVWGHTPPATTRKSLQNQIVRLRSVIGPAAISTTDAGYRLDPEIVTSDIAEFSELEGVALEPAAAPSDGLATAVAAIELWSPTGDPPFEWPSDARREYDRLLERRAHLEERHVDLLLSCGESGAAIDLARRLVDRQPFREQRWALLMLALYREGRRRDALAVFGAARRRFLDEIGIEPGPTLRRLEAQIVADDPRLMASAVATPGWQWRTVADESEVFVGRRPELEWLAQQLADVERLNGARLVDVAGEPGIGKTALVDAFLARRAEWPGGSVVLVGRCDPFADQALHTVTEALMSAQPIDTVRAAANTDSDPAALAAVLPDLVDRPARGTAEVTRDRIEDAVVRVLRELGRRGRLVMVLDDLHWATPRLGHLISRLLDGDAGDVLVVITRRDTDPADPGILETLQRAREQGIVRHLALGPLPPDAVDTYLSHVFGAPLDRTELAAWLLERTEGHPLFVRELTHHLVATNALELDGTGVRLRGDIGPLPDSLKTALGERIAILSAATVATLQLVAAAGQSCDLTLLQALAGDVTFALQESQRARLLQTGDLVGGGDEMAAVVLTHDLVRKYLYELMPEPRRIETHERIATCLVAVGGDTADVAHHFRAAATLDTRRAVEWSVRAGREATQAFDHDAAVRHFAAARAIVERGSIEDIELAVHEGAARRRAGDPDHVDCLLSAAEEARQLGDGSLLARAMIELGDLGGTTQAGSTDERVVPLLEDALVMVRDPALEARLRAAVSVFFSLSEQWPRVRALWESAAETAEAMQDDALLLAVYQSADHGTGAPDQLERRREVSARLAELAARHQDANGAYIADYLAFTAALHAGTATEIDGLLERLTRFDREVAHGAKVWTVTFLRAGRAQLSGRLDEAESLNELALSLGTGMARSWTFAVYSGMLIAIRKEQDRLAELRDDVSALVASQPGMQAWRAVAAYVAADVGDHDVAARHLADVVSGGQVHLPHDMTWMAAAAMLAQVAVATGDRERAEVMARALAPYSGRSTCSGPCVFGTVDTSLGDLALLLGDAARAAGHYQRAQSVATRLGAPILRGEAEAALAGLQLQRDDVVVLERICAEAEQYGWHRLARGARSALSTA